MKDEIFGPVLSVLEAGETKSSLGALHKVSRVL